MGDFLLLRVTGRKRPPRDSLHILCVCCCPGSAAALIVTGRRRRDNGQPVGVRRHADAALRSHSRQHHSQRCDGHLPALQRAHRSAPG